MKNFLNYFKIRKGFSVAKQIEFVIALNEQIITEPQLSDANIINELSAEFPHITKVINHKILEGITLKQSLSDVIEDSLVLYIGKPSLETELKAKRDICRILKTHESTLKRHLILNFLCLLSILIGMFLSISNLTITSAILLLVLNYAIKPLSNLNAIRKLI